MTKSDLVKIIKQLEFCEFTCQGGSLEYNASFVKLKQFVSNLPDKGAIHYPDSDCEKHTDIVLDAPICPLCLIEKIDTQAARIAELEQILGDHT